MPTSRRNRGVTLKETWLGLLLALGATGCGGGDVADSSTPSTATVSLTQTGPGSSRPTFEAWARFQRDSVEASCAMEQDSDCVLVRCQPSDGGSSAATPTIDAGNVTVTGAQTITLERETGYYWWSEGTLFDPGQTIAVEIQGNHRDPPPFATKIVGPGSVTVLSPTGSSITADRAQGITFGWTPTTGDYVVVGTTDRLGATVDVTCVWPMSAGQGVVPASVLGTLAPGFTAFSVESESLVDQRVGHWLFAVGAFVQSAIVNITLE
jgi:hypothetical protein